MIKMHLTATPPNEGARRLAWWIGETLRGDVAWFAKRAELSEQTVERLLTGEIHPGEYLGSAVWQATDFTVGAADWNARPKAGWFERPVARPSIAALARAA